MNIDNFDFTLPSALIADSPASERDQAKLLLLDKKTGAIRDYFFYDLVDLLKPGDVLVLNNSKVFPARLIGQKEITGGKIELLLSRQIEDDLWEVVGKNLKIDSRINFPDSKMEAAVVGRREELYLIRFSLGGEAFFKEIEKIGKVPVPPYINKKRQKVLSEKQIVLQEKDDSQNYQTVYATDRGSVAAPTAGLHFTEKLLEQLKDKGVEILEITLHVGLGTFAPIKVKNIEDHKIHSEHYSVSSKVLSRIIEAKKANRRIIAVGTTTARTLEAVFSQKIISSLSYPPSGISCWSSPRRRGSLGESTSVFNKIPDQVGDDIKGWTNIYIYPGYKFQCIDGLITNFHIPKSSLLLLVSAFASRDNIMRAYKHAIKKNYRFYSYGDAMLII